MAKITINFPSAEEEELIRRFTVNRNYLHALAGFLTTTYGRPKRFYPGLLGVVSSRPAYTKIQRSSADLAEIRRFLTLAWTSEIQLHLPAIMGNDATIGLPMRGLRYMPTTVSLAAYRPGLQQTAWWESRTITRRPSKLWRS